MAQWNAIRGDGKSHFSIIQCTDGIAGIAEEIPTYLKMGKTVITGCDRNTLPADLVIPRRHDGNRLQCLFWLHESFGAA